MRLALAHLAKRESLRELLQALRPLAQEARERGAGLCSSPSSSWANGRTPGFPRPLGSLRKRRGFSSSRGTSRKEKTACKPSPRPRLRQAPPLPGGGEEGDEGLRPGERPLLLPWEGRAFGLALCYDLDFPELFRAYALKGAQGFLVGAAWPGEYAGLLEVLARARAAENQAYLFLASRADTGSPSLFVAPDGRVLARREEEGLLVAEPDWGFLEAYRKKYPSSATAGRSSTGFGKMAPVLENRRARHDYEILETYEAGIALKGTEVKSLRAGKVDFTGSFARFEDGELYLENLYIAPYEKGSYANVDPRRKRKLLLHKHELRRLLGKVEQKGLTLVPLKIYFNERGYAKVLLGLARGKKAYEKRREDKKEAVRRALEEL